MQDVSFCSGVGPDFLCQARKIIFADSEAALCDAAAVVTEAIGCDDYGFMHLSPNHKPAVIDRRPKAWITEYTQNNWMPIDPIVSYAMKADRPFFWADACQCLTSQQKEIMDRAAAFKMKDGLVVPIIGFRLEKAFLFFWAEQTLDPVHITKDIEALTVFCSSFFQAWARLNATRILPAVTLTPREREALLYAALNHSNSVIATTMKISEATVRTHIDNAAEKLNVTGKQGAVVKAILYQLIHP